MGIWGKYANMKKKELKKKDPFGFKVRDKRFLQIIIFVLFWFLLFCPWWLIHLDQLKGEALVKDAIYFSSTWQLHCVHLVPGALDPLLEVHRELLHHSETHQIQQNRKDFNNCQWKMLLLWLTPCTDCNSCLVLRDGSSGRYPRYSSASLSRASSWACSLLRNAGRVSRMWLVSC